MKTNAADSTILVTGGAGYIGSHACKQLTKAGYTPVVLDNLSRGHRWAVKWGPLEVADIADPAAVTAILKKYRPAEPIRETAPQNPVSPYGFSKLVIERMLLDYSIAYGFKAVMPRYFNASGADPDGEIGELHDPEPHLIPNVLRVARADWIRC